MNTPSLNPALCVLVAALLCACGGGGDDAASSTPGGGSGGSNVVRLESPTAALVANASTAEDLTTEAQAAFSAATQLNQLPSAFTFSGVPLGAVVTQNCPAGGSYGVDYPDALTANTRYSITYNNCAYGAGYVYAGSIVVQYHAFSQNNYAYTYSYDLTYTYPGGSLHQTADQTCTFTQGSALSCLRRDGNRTFSADFSYRSGVINGTYQWAYGSRGVVSYRFISWGATSGRIEITGANGSSAVIVRNSATSYTVTITVNGTATVYNVTRA